MTSHRGAEWAGRLNSRCIIGDIINPKGYPNYNSISGDTIAWNFSDLKPLDSATIVFKFKADPLMQPGDSILSVATIYPVAGDEIPDDNTASLSQKIVIDDSYSNDKIENHNGILADTREYLSYT